MGDMATRLVAGVLDQEAADAYAIAAGEAISVETLGVEVPQLGGEGQPCGAVAPVDGAGWQGSMHYLMALFGRLRETSGALRIRPRLAAATNQSSEPPHPTPLCRFPREARRTWRGVSSADDGTWRQYYSGGEGAAGADMASPRASAVLSRRPSGPRGRTSSGKPSGGSAGAFAGRLSQSGLLRLSSGGALWAQGRSPSVGESPVQNVAPWLAQLPPSVAEEEGGSSRFLGSLPANKAAPAGPILRSSWTIGSVVFGGSRSIRSSTTSISQRPTGDVVADGSTQKRMSAAAASSTSDQL